MEKSTCGISSFLTDLEHDAVEAVRLEDQFGIALGLVRDTVEHVASLDDVFGFARSGATGEQFRIVDVAQE